VKYFFKKGMMGGDPNSDPVVRQTKPQASPYLRPVYVYLYKAIPDEMADAYLKERPRRAQHPQDRSLKMKVSAEYLLSIPMWEIVIFKATDRELLQLRDFLAPVYPYAIADMDRMSFYAWMERDLAQIDMNIANVRNSTLGGYVGDSIRITESEEPLQIYCTIVSQDREQMLLRFSRGSKLE